MTVVVVRLFGITVVRVDVERDEVDADDVDAVEFLTTAAPGSPAPPSVCVPGEGGGGSIYTGGSAADDT
jgi:hypothetical protein